MTNINVKLGMIEIHEGTGVLRPFFFSLLRESEDNLISFFHFSFGEAKDE